MPLNRNIATPDQKEGYIRNLQWAFRQGVCFNDLPCTDDLAGADGIHLEVIVDSNRDDDHILAAIAEAKSQRDVVCTSVTVVPQEWLREAIGQSFDRDEFHDYVVSHGCGAPTEEAYQWAEAEFYRGIPYATLGHEVAARSLVEDVRSAS